MDFVEGLPTLGSANAILVVADKFSKFAHFVPLRHPFTAESVAKLFLDHVYRLHGLPLSIITDRDRIFASKFWQSLFRLAGVELKMSTDKLKGLISAEKCIYTALLMLARTIGLTGWQQRSSGIILLLIPL